MRASSLAVVVGLLALPTLAFAQRRVEPETISGKIKEIEKKGRLRTLVVTAADGKEMTFPLPPKVEFEVQLQADDSLVQPDSYIAGKAVLSNNQLFVQELTVYLSRQGKHPPARVRRADAAPGVTSNDYDVAGFVAERKQSTEYPEYEIVTLRLAGEIPPLMLDKKCKISAVSADPEQARPDDPVELTVIPLRGGRYNLVKAVVTGGKAVLDVPDKSP